ncbi:MAG: hypothetical protein ABSF89_18300 [Acidimicrobiales bacterium]
MSSRPRPDPLPRALRRRADRPAVPRSQPPDALIAQARAGIITRRNTRPGTRGRQAADAVVYRSRARRTSPEETVRARLGHAPAPEVVWSAVTTTSGVIEVLTTTRRESSRVGAYSHDVGLLLDGDLEPTHFERKWRRRRRDMGPDVELEWRAEVVIALMAAAGPAPEPFYRRRRPMGGRSR